MLGKLYGFNQLVNAVGLAAATKLASHREIQRGTSDAVTEIRIKGSKFPIFLRVASSDYHVFNQVLRDREYDEPTKSHSGALRSRYERIISEGHTPVIIDCGANIGLASLWYLKQFPRATVVAIEPEPKNFELLSTNLSGYSNAIPLNAGISDHRHKVSLSNRFNDPWTWETTASDEGNVAAITIEDALHHVDGAVPLIAKIDIEGFEAQLFHSGYAWVNDFPLIVCEYHDWMFPWRGTAHALFSALSEFGVRDYVQRGENVFSYSHALLKPDVGNSGNHSGPTRASHIDSPIS